MINTIEGFFNAINSNSIFYNEIFNLENRQLAIQSFNNNWITFENCTFNCGILEFKNIKNSELIIEFKECTFDCELSFSNCVLDRLTFWNTKKINSLDIRKGLPESSIFELNDFEFRYSKNNVKPEIIANFYFSKTKVNRYFAFENVNHLGGKFEFIENHIGTKEDEFSQAFFRDTCFSNSFFIRNTFQCFTHFNNSKFFSNIDPIDNRNSGYKNTKFYKNIFSKVDFSNSEFNDFVEFDNCDFTKTSWFEKCFYSIDKNHLVFIACKFEKYSLFDNSKCNKLEIYHSKFLEKASFDSVEVNNFKLHQVTFAEAAYFDDLNKNMSTVVGNWDRSTLRNIKRELANSQNQIDYLRFKAYELNAFKKEKGKNWKDNIILYFNESSNNFGLDWIKGVLFILKWSFGFYMFFLITFVIIAKSTNCLPRTLEDFSVGYLKFINPLSFLKSPIEEAENYFFPLFFMLIGKVFVSYGIYQTIQAFRKFGVKGD